MRAARLMLALALIIAGPLARAQEAEPGLALDLQTLVDAILPAQPVRVIARLRVQGDDVVQGAVPFKPAWGRIGLTIRSDRGEAYVNLREVVLVPPAWGDWVPPGRAMAYQPGFEAVIDTLVVHDAREVRYLLDEPGRYSLQLSVLAFLGPDIDSYRAVTIESNAVHLTVAEPEGEEQLAARMWRLPWGMPQEGAADRLGLSSCPNTSYAQYAAFAMSSWETISRVERIRMLEELARQGPPEQIADLVLLRLAELLMAERDYAAAAEWAARVEDVPTAPQHVRERAAALREQAERSLAREAN